MDAVPTVARITVILNLNARHSSGRRTPDVPSPRPGETDISSQQGPGLSLNLLSGDKPNLALIDLSRSAIRFNQPRFFNLVL